MMVSSFVLWLLAAAAMGSGGASVVPCKSVADCWLDQSGRPIPRPKAKRGRPLPKGDCGKNLIWLRTQLRCQDQVCVATDVGDEC